jgi:hypothetical protein
MASTTIEVPARVGGATRRIRAIMIYPDHGLVRRMRAGG